VTWRREMRMDQIQLQREQDCVEHGNLRDGQGMFEKAIAAYDIALKIDPEDADALFDKGMTLKKMGNHTEGNKLIDEAVQLYMR
jgi:tetratricopeptide (TPR) repeat protein